MEYAEGASSKVYYEKVKIYSLSDNEGSVFYVGCTTQAIEYRIGGHIIDAKYATKYPPERRSRKNQKIIDLGFRFDANIICIKLFAGSLCSLNPRRVALEKEYIKKFIDEGHPLLNRETKKKIVNPRVEDCAGKKVIVSNGKIIKAA